MHSVCTVLYRQQEDAMSTTGFKVILNKLSRDAIDGKNLIVKFTYEAVLTARMILGFNLPILHASPML